MIKNLPTISESWVPSLDQEDPLEKGMATRYSILVMYRGGRKRQAIVHGVTKSSHRQFKHKENNTRILDLLKNDLVRKTKQNLIWTKHNEILEEFQNRNNIINISSSQLVVIFLT